MSLSNPTSIQLTRGMLRQRDGISKRLDIVRGGRSQRQWARNLGVSQQNISRYLKGTSPKVEFLIVLKERDGVDLNWLLTGK